MKKQIKIILFALILIVGILINNETFAATAEDLTSNDLIYLEIKGQGRIISKTTTISEIESWYSGENELITESLFGGNAYSFWVGDKYDDYLYIETIEDGRIFSYGSTDPTYVTNTYSYGDDYPYSERNSLHGCMLSDDGIVIAGIHYNKSIYLNGSSSKIISAYKTAFLEDETKSMLDLTKHSTIMFNSIERAFNNEKCFLTFNEDYFYTNQQFREFGTTLMTYMYEMDYGLSYYTTLGTKSNCDLAYSTYYCMNPLQLAGMAKLQKNANFGDRIYPVWNYDYDKKILSGAVYSTTCFERANEVNLTDEEKSRLIDGRDEYNQAITLLNKSSDIYKTTPINNSATNIRAGELLQDKKEGITHYMNAIRVAGGLGRVALDEEGFNIAQHMSTLLSYRFIELGLPMAHLPAQPEGVSLEYYRTAIGYATPWVNNLVYSASDVTVSNMMRYVSLLIHDEDGTYNFGHRYYLLYPNYTKYGFGITKYFGVVELSGYRQADPIVVGWPMVDGVTFLETLIDEKFKWTIQFFSKYELLNSSTVKIECLNTGEVWNFDSEVDTYSKVYQNLVEGDVVDSFSNKILLYDNTIEPRAGYVYKVTVNGLKNTETGNIESYSYRTVFAYADTSSYAEGLTSVTIEEPDMEQIETNVYEGLVGQTIKLTASIEDTSVVDKKVTWTSSNSDAVSVTQNGIITIKKLTNEDVTITVSYDGDNTIMDQIIIRPKKITCKIEGSDNVFTSLGEKIQLTATLSNGESTTFTWKSSNSNIVSVDSNGTATAVRGGYAVISVTESKYNTSSTYGFYVCVPVTLSDGSKAYVGDMNKNGYFNATDSSMILDVFKNGGTTDEVILADVNCDGFVNSTDSSLILEWFMNARFSPGKYYPITAITLDKTSLNLSIGSTYNLLATITPTNTTDSPYLTYTSSDNSKATVNENGVITGVSAGTVTITATAKNGVTATCEVIVEEYLLGDVDLDGDIDATDATYVLQYIGKKRTLNDIQLLAADVDKNNTINANDVVKILQYVGRKITSF